MGKRKFLYMVYNENEQSVTSTGIEFADFVHALPIGINHILLLDSGYAEGEFHAGLRMEYVRKERLQALYKENVYAYGDFCWVDFEEVAVLNKLEPQEKAELLYLGHFKQPLESPFFEKLCNQFVYLAHDDGWFNKVFYKNAELYTGMLRQLVANRLKTYGLDTPPITADVGEQLKLFAKDGLLIESSRLVKSHTGVEVPLHVIGTITNHDELYNNIERYKSEARSQHWLVYKNGEWTIRQHH
ncbi:hypothetical protein [Cohnella sp. GCM10012308]|uniref:hypothetical protein n=1 Tax=Cohnella sp. GCM10012308 TaxID=3317329 RepID=UPI003618A6C2